MTLDYKLIGKRIKMQRTYMGYTQEKLAEETGLSTSHISNIETGSTKIGLRTLIIIANALETKPDNLLCDSIKYAKENFEYYIVKETEDCTEMEIRIISDIIRSVKTSIRARTKDLQKSGDD